MNNVTTLFDTNTLIVGEKVNVMSNRGKNFECSYEVTFNGEDRVDVVMPGSSIGWVPRFSITLTPPESSHVYKMLYEFVDGLSPRPFENMGVTEYEDNVGMANDQLTAIKRDLENMANQGQSFLIPKTWRACFDFMIRPVMRFSQPVFAEDIKFAHPIPAGFAELGFVRASDVKVEVGMRLLSLYAKNDFYKPCVVINADQFPDAEEILFLVRFEDGHEVGVFNDELVKILGPDDEGSTLLIDLLGEKGVSIGIDPGKPVGDRSVITDKLSTDFGSAGLIIKPDDLTDPE